MLFRQFIKQRSNCQSVSYLTNSLEVQSWPEPCARYYCRNDFPNIQYIYSYNNSSLRNIFDILEFIYYCFISVLVFNLLFYFEYNQKRIIKKSRHLMNCFYEIIRLEVIKSLDYDKESFCIDFTFVIDLLLQDITFFL